MVNIWLIRPGDGARLWEDCRDNKCIAIGWDNEDGYLKYKNLDDVKNHRDSNQDANAIWSFYKEIEIGDVIVAPGGINSVLGIGKVTSDYIDPKDSNNPGIEYKNVRMVDWLITDKLENIPFSTQLPQKTLTKENRNQRWEEIKAEYIKMNPENDKIFNSLIKNENKYNKGKKNQVEISDTYLQTLKDTFSQTKNVILYGPPGTGKTYIAQQFIEFYLNDQVLTPKTFKEIQIESIKDLTWHEVIAISIYLKGKDQKIRVPDLKNEELIKYYFEIVKGRTKHIGQILWSQLQIHANSNSETIKYQNRSEPALFDKTSESEWYLIPEGIEYIENSFADILSILREDKKFTDKTTIKQYNKFVTFHQSYGYEDFLEGLKPKIDDIGVISYEIEPGVFKDICLKAKNDSDNKYLLIIDEINRGNIAKIFGELITLIEDDKRLGEKNELIVTLPYSKEEFVVPSNLYIMGTMNTADRSIALLDIALRRRFTFLEIMPDYSIMNYEIDEGLNIGNLLEKLNDMVAALIDRDHQIGHSYFCGIVKKIKQGDLKSAKIELQFVWYRKIIPLLQEYFYNDWEQLKHVLGSGFVLENSASNNNTKLQDRMVNKNYSIIEFEDWNGFSNALRYIVSNGTKKEVQADSTEPESIGEGNE